MARKPKSPVDMASCTNCDWRGPANMLREIADAWERLVPGESYWDGDCPKCGASAYRDDTNQMMDELYRTKHADELPALVKAAEAAIRGGDDDYFYSSAPKPPLWLRRLKRAVAKAKAVIKGGKP